MTNLSIQLRDGTVVYVRDVRHDGNGEDRWVAETTYKGQKYSGAWGDLGTALSNLAYSIEHNTPDKETNHD